MKIICKILLDGKIFIIGYTTIITAMKCTLAQLTNHFFTQIIVEQLNNI